MLGACSIRFVTSQNRRCLRCVVDAPPADERSSVLNIPFAWVAVCRWLKSLRHGDHGIHLVANKAEHWGLLTDAALLGDGDELDSELAPLRQNPHIKEVCADVCARRTIPWMCAA